MAGFRTHITVSSTVGVIYGGAAVQPMGFETDAGILAAGITAIGGMLPDLDSDSGIPVREMFGLAAAILPILLLPRLVHAGMTREAILATMLFGYLFVRYVVSRLFNKLSVHRGMYHSIPAMFIAGLVVYLAYHSPDRDLRILMAVGVMLGFASHLILDEIYSVDLRGVKIVLKSSAGSAVKFSSSSLVATATCYAILGGLGYIAYKEYMKPPEPEPPPERRRNRRMMSGEPQVKNPQVMIAWACDPGSPSRDEGRPHRDQRQ